MFKTYFLTSWHYLWTSLCTFSTFWTEHNFLEFCRSWHTFWSHDILCSFWYHDILSVLFTSWHTLWTLWHTFLMLQLTLAITCFLTSCLSVSMTYLLFDFMHCLASWRLVSWTLCNTCDKDVARLGILSILGYKCITLVAWNLWDGAMEIYFLFLSLLCLKSNKVSTRNRLQNSLIFQLFSNSRISQAKKKVSFQLALN